VILGDGAERRISLSGVLVLWRKRMLEWNPRLVALVAGLAALALSLGWVFSPDNFGWGAW
jgi:hypothetical protein